jgi:predicted site-specific integrase-resolvase
MLRGEPPERLLDVGMVAQQLDRCSETVRRYIRAGYLRAWRAPGDHSRGGNYLIPESAVREFLATSYDISPRHAPHVVAAR